MAIRGQIEITGRSFAVASGNFDEVMPNGTNVVRGTVSNDSRPVTMAATPQQLLIASAGLAYVFDLQTNVLTQIPSVTFSGPVSQADVCDDFFLLTIKNSKEFYVSAPLDATDWVTNGSAIVSVFPDNLVNMKVVHRQIFFTSDTKAVFYYDSGNIFPFDVIPGSDMDQGSAAENACSLLYNTVFWIGADERGHGVGWMANGYTPQRVSNHAIETAWQSYTRIDDAVSLAYQDQGHYFWQIYFPTPSVTWTYDVLTGMWHQRAHNIQVLGTPGAARYQNHSFNFGKHLVGDWATDKIYELHIPIFVGSAWEFADDFGEPIIRTRRAPHISKEQKYQTHHELQVFVQPGLGPIPPLLDGSGNPRPPEIMLRWSNDAGQTWSNWHTRSVGMAGEYKNRSRWLRLGTTRDRIYEMQCSDSISWRVIDAYLRSEDGSGV